MMQDGSIDIGMLLKEGSRETGHPVAQQMAAELCKVLEIPSPVHHGTWVMPTSKLFKLAFANVVLDSLMIQLEYILAFHLEVHTVKQSSVDVFFFIVSCCS